MFRGPHLVFSVSSALAVFIFTRFLYDTLPFFTFDLIKLRGQGKKMPLWDYWQEIVLMEAGRSHSVLASSLGCQCFGTKINVARLLEMSVAPSNVG